MNTDADIKRYRFFEAFSYVSVVGTVWTVLAGIIVLLSGIEFWETVFIVPSVLFGILALVVGFNHIKRTIQSVKVP